MRLEALVGMSVHVFTRVAVVSRDTAARTAPVPPPGVKRGASRAPANSQAGDGVPVLCFARH